MTIGGKPDHIAYSDLVRYPHSLPGVSVAIIGTGIINREKPEGDQMVANLAATLKDPPSAIEMARIEKEAEARHGARPNYFQEKTNLLAHPTVVNTRMDGDRIIVEWNTGLAGREPIRSYEIWAGSQVVASLPFRPQLYEAPLRASIPASFSVNAAITVTASEKPPRVIA